MVGLSLARKTPYCVECPLLLGAVAFYKAVSLSA